MLRYLVLAFVLLVLTTGLKADELPIKVSWRPSILTAGTFVFKIVNDGDKNLLLHVQLDRADASARKTYTLVVPSYHFKEIGHLQGWNGKSGDIISVSAEGYDQWQSHIP